MGIADSIDGGYFKDFFRPRERFIFEKDVVLILNPDDVHKEILKKHGVKIQKIDDEDIGKEGAAITYFELLGDTTLLNLVFDKHKFSDVPNMIIGIANTVKDMPDYRDFLNMICDKLDSEHIAHSIYQDIEDEEFRVYMQIKFGGFPNCEK